MEPGLLEHGADHIREALGREPADTKLCIVTDETVAGLYGSREHALWQSLEHAGYQVFRFVFPGGEETKNIKTIEEILNYLADNRFSRSDALIALGGGITGDVTGFAAASFLRGIEFIQIPTSLLAVVDSSVGGKTGVNLNAGKNLAGAFWQPSAVLFDPNVLETLSDDLKLDGIAEAIKAGIIGGFEGISEARDLSGSSGSAACSEMSGGDVIPVNKAISGAAGSAACSEMSRSDVISEHEKSNNSCQISNTAVSMNIDHAGMPENIKTHEQGEHIDHVPAINGDIDLNDHLLLTHIAAAAVDIKRRIVEEDERESGVRQLLNLGHTPAHAIEKCSNYTIRHGHAVAIGMAMISTAAATIGWTTPECRDSIINMLKSFGFSLECRYTPGQLAEAALRDKKVRGSNITLVIPESYGKCMLRTIPTDRLEEFFTLGME